ncbi:hypothetical protein HMPREF3230_01203 [Gardnerella vaginalis]|uniref:Uncharacterized protein n=1 Tax=Gardnerella vaginalis TaxID=2702 RepID=A0A135Z3N2_GARVA|nr:hypothetical protein HMPREF3230_01203 [Gardnerella vaginalis]
MTKYLDKYLVRYCKPIFLLCVFCVLISVLHIAYCFVFTV